MRNYYKHIIIILLAIVLFVPFYPVTIVPEWELLFKNKDDTPATISIKQIWKHYSYEWLFGEHTNEGLQTDSNGYIKLPAREIRVSLFKIIISTIWETININPHASFGPHSYIICEGKQDCSVVSYKNGIEQPQRVILK